MKLSVAHLDDELRVSAVPIIAIVALVGQSLVVFAISQSKSPLHFELQLLGLLSCGVAGASWLLHRWSVRVGRWSIVCAVVVLIFLAQRWLQMPELLSLLGIPTVLAAAMIGLPGAAAVASAVTGLLTLMPGVITPGTPWGTLAVALVVIWAMLGLMATVYRPVQRRAEWLALHAKQAQQALQEAHDRKEQMAQTEAAWKNASRQIRLANERLASLRLVAEEAKRSKAAFVANVSHEFRTPLNIITGLISVLVEVPEVYDGTFSPKALEYLQVVYRNSQHLASMIDDVLDLSQVEAGRMALHREWTDLGNVVGNAADSIKPLIEEKGLALKLAAAEDLPPVYCDGVRIRQVIMNLLSNAVRLTAQGSITVDATQRNQHVVLSVADTGPGIPPEAADEIFEPFSKASTQFWHERAGSGLGLSVSQQFVRLHGGRMWVDSELGVGTTFFVELPISEPQEHLVRPDWGLKEDWIWREQTFRSRGAGLAHQVIKPRVVVCDETAELHAALARYSDGFEYVEASSLPEALHVLRECPARALVVNEAAPSRLWSLIEAAIQESPDTPIVGCCCPPSIEHAFKAGAVGYLTKPIGRRELGDLIERTNRTVRRILVVDDEAEVRELMTLFLHTYDETLEVLTAESGARALALMRTAQPDLVLLDIVMPDLDGWGVLAKAKAKDTLKDIPVAMVSGQDPRERPMRSKMLVAAMGDGISLSKLLDCSRDLSTRLLQPD